MKFSVEPKIFEKFPGVKIGVLVLTGMENSGHDRGILKILREEEIRQKELLENLELNSLPEVSSWRKIYKDFGSGSDYRSSVEALLRRAKKGDKPLPQINNLVDIYNYLSLKYHLPVGAEDLDKIEGDVELVFARGDEMGIYLGSEEEEAAYKGEVIYRDKAGFICRRWNWREADRTKIEENTVNAVLVMEKVPELGEELFQTALDEAQKLIGHFLGAKIEKQVLDPKNNVMNSSFVSGAKIVKILDKNKAVKDRTKEVKVPVKKVSGNTKSLFSEILEWDKAKGLEEEIRYIIYQILIEIYGVNIKIELKSIKIEHPKLESYGDYSTNIALILSSELHIKPQAIAEAISNKVNEYIIKHQSISIPADSKDLSDKVIRVSDVLEKSSFVLPGFVNLTIQPEYLITQVSGVLNRENGVKSTQNHTEGKMDLLAGRRIVVEFAHPNTHKAFHIGHLRNIITGETIVRILESMGAEVIRANYQGDVGMHIAKCLYAIIRNPEFSILNSERLSSREKAEILGKYYAEGSKAFEEDNRAKEEIKDINYLIYASAQKFQQEKGRSSSSTDYLKFVQGKKEELDKIFELWKTTRQWSLEYFGEIYNRVYTNYDRYFFESECLSGVDIVRAALGSGILKEDEGAVIFEGKPYGLDTRVFVNNQGLPTYEAKELALASREFSEFGQIDKCIHVVGPEQASFFQVTFKVEELLDEKKFKNKQYHLIYGWVKLKKGKMSSRLGNVVLGEWLLDEAKEKIFYILEKSPAGYSPEMKDDIAEKVAIGAVKYSMLKVGTRQDISFDLDESISFEGDSGPYLMYTYARCKSVIRKSESHRPAGGPNSKFIISPQPATYNLQLNSEELALLRTLYRFDEVVTDAARTISPNLICGHLFDLAQKYNLFYNKHQIIYKKLEVGSGKLEVGSGKSGSGKENDYEKMSFRLFLTEATSIILKKGLYLLGIETVEKM